ncbi:MAG: hypothetical protein K0R27_3919 [Xanthobacteraceae bacterium]|jgi:hypothetical protein|nr:hypothetical protein [Xanthobacteraceae bacterium]
MNERYVSPAAASHERETLHEIPRPEKRRSAAVLIGSIAVALALMAGALAGYLTLELTALKGEIARLRAEQADSRAALQTLQAQAWAVDSGAAISAPEFDRFIDFGKGGPTLLPTLGNTSNDTTAPASPPPIPQNSPPYSVRVFAPSASLDKNKLQQFANAVKAAGFSIEISEDAVSQPLNPSIMYRSSSVDIANKLSTALKSKYPSIHFEMRGSDAFPENLKNVMIVNLTADVFK